MEVILSSKTKSKQVVVSETDSISSLKDTFEKSTGEGLPACICYQDKFGNELSPELTFKQAGISSGDVIFIVYLPYNHFQRIPVLSLLLVVFVIGVCGLTLGYRFSRVQPSDYAMVFDAGSTHTEMKVFEWQSDKFRGTGIVREIDACPMKGGIGEVLREEPRKAGEYLQECLQEGLRVIPEERRGHSPVFFAATAGMRVLELEDWQAMQEIMGNISRVLQSTGMLYDQRNVRIITGKEEAVSGWISVNYLLQSLHPVCKSTIGNLDLGGASTQIAFVQNEGVVPSVFDEWLKLYGEEYDVAALSYLCFGQKTIYKRYLVTLLQAEQPSSNVTITSPCHNDGYRNTLKYEDLLSPCTNTSYLSSFHSITIMGSYDYSACRTAVSELLNPEKCRSNFAKEFCFFQPPEHNSNMSFVATSGFYHTASNLKVKPTNGTLNEFSDAGRTHCEKPWEKVIKVNDTEFQTEIKTVLCFNANYNLLLLTKGYGFNNESWSKISFVDKINGTGIGWQLGFAVRSTNYVPEEGKINRFSSDVFAGLLFVFAFIIGACATLLTARLLVARRLRNRVVLPSDEGMAQA